MLTLEGVTVCPSDVRHVVAGREHSTDHTAGVAVRRRHPPPLGRHGDPDLLQPPLRVPAPGLHGVVSSCVSQRDKGLPHPESLTQRYQETLSKGCISERTGLQCNQTQQRASNGFHSEQRLYPVNYSRFTSFHRGSYDSREAEDHTEYLWPKGVSEVTISQLLV